jgi:hypothetical protein
MGAGGANSLPAQGLRLLEHSARAFEVVGGDHDPHAPERGVGKIDVDVSVGELPGQLAERHGSAETLAHAAGSSYLPVALLMARTAVSMICSSRLLWAPRQYTWPQLWQRENAW